MSKEIVLEVGEGKSDYPKLHQHISPVLRQFARDRRDVKLTHSVDETGLSTITIVAQPKVVDPTEEELADNKATSVKTDEPESVPSNPVPRRRTKPVESSDTAE